jgi:tetratricopeptide (TPR) repeat protein
LGEAFRTLGEARKAIGYYEQAQVIVRNAYGEQHPHVAASLNNLGAAYFQLGRKDRARPYFEKALAIFIHFYGTEHPDSIMVKEWLDHCG